MDDGTTDLTLGIDVGTSGVRAAATRADGSLAGTASVPMPPPERDGTRVTQDPAIWWDATDRALRRLFATVEARRVRAVAVDGTSGTVLAVTCEGVPLGPASLYNDGCPPALAARVAAVAPDGSAARGATSALGRAITLQDRPGTARLLHQADWIAGRLTGRFATADENNALKTGYDPVARAWPDWIARTGLRVDLLPAVVPAGRVLGPLDAAVRDSYGLPADAVAVAGTTDGCAAFLATGATAPGEAVTSLGSTLVLKLLSDRPIVASAYGVYSHRIGDAWLAGGASNSGGAALLRFFSVERMAALEPDLDPDRPLGLNYYPLPAPGERFPVADPALPSRTDPRPAGGEAAFFQALLEGVAGVEALGYARLAALGAPPLRSVRSVGGGARNLAFARIRSRTLGVPLIEPAQGEAACGAAALAWRGLAEARGPA